MERKPPTPDPLGRFQRNQYPESDWDHGLCRRTRSRPQPAKCAARLVELHPDSGPTSSNADRRPLHVLTVTIAFRGGKFPPLLLCAEAGVPHLRRIGIAHVVLSVGREENEGAPLFAPFEKWAAGRPAAE